MSTLTKLDVHRARKVRAVQMAKKCRDMGNPAAEAIWLELAGKEADVIQSMERHPAYLATLRLVTTNPSENQE